MRRFLHRTLANLAAFNGWHGVRKWHQRTCPHLEKNDKVWADVHCAWCGQPFDDPRANAFFFGTESDRIEAGYKRITAVGQRKMDWVMRLASEAMAWDAKKKQNPGVSSSNLPMLIATIITAKDAEWPDDTRNEVA